MTDSIVFLDIDGVMLTGRMSSYGGRPAQFDPEALDALDWICDTTGAQIVLSSTWREGDWSRVKESLRIRGFRRELLSRTPLLERMQGGIYIAPTRGQEIGAWLNQYHADTGREIAYVILDDESDMGVHRPHLVQTHFSTGLTHELAEKAVRMLEDRSRRLAVLNYGRRR